MTDSSKTQKSWNEIQRNLNPFKDGLHTQISENWRQGRTCYGGLTAALMLETTRRSFSDLPALRSALINFVGPVTEDPIFSSTLLRRGQNVTNISSEAKIGDQSVGRADFLFGASRESVIDVKCSAPEAPKAEDCDPFIPEAVKKLTPGFFHNFDTRLIAGARPMMGEDGYIRTWSRHLDPYSREGIGSLLCLADVLPPAAMPLMRTMAPISSMSWLVNVLSPKPETVDGWWQVETRLSAAQSGYSTQVMRIWNVKGDLVIEGMQSVAIFG